MKAQTFNLTGDNKSETQLPESVFGVEINPYLIAQAIRVYLSNQRQGNADTKGRSEVTGSTRKVYRQKGTGNARHGDIKAPVFVGGGIVHGPVSHTFKLSMPLKMKKAALRSALSAQATNVVVLEGMTKLGVKTKEMANGLKAAVIDRKKPIIVLNEGMEEAVKAIRNLKNVNYVQAKDLNIFEVMTHDVLIFTKEAIDTVKSRLAKGKEGQGEQVESEITKPKTRTRKPKEESEK